MRWKSQVSTDQIAFYLGNAYGVVSQSVSLWGRAKEASFFPSLVLKSTLQTVSLSGDKTGKQMHS